MKLIDFHTHIYPELLSVIATRSVEDFYSIKAESIGTARELTAVSEKAGVSLNVILPVAIRPSVVSHINNFASEMQREHEKITAFGTLHADMESPEEEIIRIEEMGLRGVKLHPDSQHFNIDDERLFPVYDYMQGKMILFTHTGDPRYDFSHPGRLRRVMEEFPRLMCIAAHFGGWSMPDEGVKYLSEKENCCVDMSSSFSCGVSLEKGKELISAFGEDRVLFGSDFPLGSPLTEKENLIRLDITHTAREKIAYKNAERLLEIKL